MTQGLSVNDWLRLAHEANVAWHKTEEYARENAPTLSLAEQRTYAMRRSLLLSQKQLCQLSALRLACEQNDTTALTLELDAQETGVSGNKVFYRISNVQYSMHIPQAVLASTDGLTSDERDFFDLRF